MADGQVKDNSDMIDNNYRTCWDFNKINEHIKSKSITYDGIRVKWCDNYESLKVFIESAFRQQGKWWSSGGNSRFDASTAEFGVIWYPGKHNTLTFNGNAGDLAKECLIELCTSSSLGNSENVEKRHCSYIDFKEGLESLTLQGVPKKTENY